MDRPMALCNRSISNRSHSDDSSQSYSVSTIGSSKLGSTVSDSIPNHSYNKKNHLKDHKFGKSNSSHHTRPKQKMRRKTKSNDRLTVSVHNSDSDLKNSQRRTGGMDRQLSISRWMADAVNEHCGKIRRAVSSHESLKDRPLSPEVIESRQNYQHPVSAGNPTENSPFQFFRKANSNNDTLSKPVRKRSSGPEGLIKDVLMALSGHERNETSSTSRKIFLPFSGSTNSTSGTSQDGIAHLINDDIEEDDSDTEVEFHSDEDVHSTTPIPDQNASGHNTPLLLQQGSRWDASSPSRKNAEKTDGSPLERLLRGSSKKMPVPPPPPFSPSSTSNKNSVGQRNLDVVPNDLFQSNSTPSSNKHNAEGGNTPCKPLRANSSQLRKHLNSNNKTLPLAPLAAASAAIAIATASMEEDEEVFSEDEVALNDLVTSSTKTRLQNNNSLNNGSESSSNGNVTDAATADSASKSDTWDDYSEDISVDGVSMLSASNTTFTSFTASFSAITNPSVGGLGSSATGSLAAYMNRVQREGTDNHRSGSSRKNQSKNQIKNGQTDLGSYMNWAKRRQQQEEQQQEQQEEEDLKSKMNSMESLDFDFSYQSLAEGTFESMNTFATFGHESPQQKPKPQVQPVQQQQQPVQQTKQPKAQQHLPLPLRACSDHHPVLALSRRDASIVPPCMPKRSVSNHEKLDIAPRTPKPQPTTNRANSPPTSATTPSSSNKNKSPTGDRVQRLLDAANKRKCKYVHPNRKASVENVSSRPVQRFRRRVTMDHTPSSNSDRNHEPETSMRRRRASLDHTLLSSHSRRSSSTPKQRLPSLTPTIIKTPRTSPAMVRQRKRVNSCDSLLAPPSMSPQSTPTNTRNLSAAAAELVDNDKTTRTSHLIEK